MNDLTRQRERSFDLEDEKREKGASNYATTYIS